ncbi:hypothetical protein HYW76_00795 [Candidatus Pacearchaeota archaeon]|nr:hypothetical protein [Candidatus Pacearchaeota archaeon]
MRNDKCGYGRAEVIGINSYFEIEHHKEHEGEEIGEITRNLEARGLEVFLNGVKVRREDTTARVD